MKDILGFLPSVTLLFELLNNLLCFLNFVLTILIVLSNTASYSEFRFLYSAKVLDDLINSMLVFLDNIAGIVAGKLALTFTFRIFCV